MPDPVLLWGLGCATLGWFGRMLYDAYRTRRERIRPERQGYGTRFWW